MIIKKAWLITQTEKHEKRLYFPKIRISDVMKPDGSFMTDDDILSNMSNGYIAIDTQKFTNPDGVVYWDISLDDFAANSVLKNSDYKMTKISGTISTTSYASYSKLNYLTPDAERSKVQSTVGIAILGNSSSYSYFLDGVTKEYTDYTTANLIFTTSDTKSFDDYNIEKEIKIENNALDISFTVTFNKEVFTNIDISRQGVPSYNIKFNSLLVYKI